MDGWLPLSMKRSPTGQGKEEEEKKYARRREKKYEEAVQPPSRGGLYGFPTPPCTPSLTPRRQSLERLSLNEVL